MTEPLKLADIDSLDFAKGDGLVSGCCPACRYGCRADGRLHESRGVPRNAVTPACCFLQPHPAATVGERGNLGPFPRARPDPRRLRSRRLARHGASPRARCVMRARRPALAMRRSRTANDSRFLGLSKRSSSAGSQRHRRAVTPRRLFAQGPKRIAQKVGEEGLEVALAAAVETDDKVVSESADLIFHLLVLLTKPRPVVPERCS